MAKRLLIVAGDFAEDQDLMAPFQALSAPAHAAHVIAPGKRAGEKIRTAIADFEGDQTYTEKRGHNFRLNADFESTDSTTLDTLLVPSGRAPEYLRLNATVLAHVRYFADTRKPIAAVRHSAQLCPVSRIAKRTHLSLERSSRWQSFCIR